MKKPFCLKKRVPQGIWYYRLSTEHTYHSTGEKSKAKAEAYAIKILNGEPVTTTVITLDAFCKDFFVWGKCEWIKRTQERGMSFSAPTAKMRREHLTKHVLPVLGNKPLNTIKTSDIDSLFAGIGLSNQTKNHILSTLSIVFKEAYRKELILRVPTVAFERFANNPKKRDILTKEELAKLFPNDVNRLVHIWGSKHYALLFGLLYSTGARQGEILALTWADLAKAKDSTILISKALKHDGTIGTTKTNKSVFVPFLEPYSGLARTLKDEMKPKSDDELVFANPLTEKPFERGLLMDTFRRVLKAKDIDIAGRNIVIHSFRHAFNTAVNQELGGDVVRLMTGHTSARMTERYDHPDIEKERQKVSSHIAELTSILSNEPKADKASA
jgi:integrase